MKKVLFFTCVAMLSVVVASAQAPLPSAFNSVTYGAISNAPYSGIFLGGEDLNGGGAFKFDATPLSSSLLSIGAPTTATAFWCVDDQLFFGWGESGTAAFVPVADVSANPTLVRYSNVTNSVAPTWTNTSVASFALPSSAQERYEMAAYLITQYGGFSATSESSVITGDINRNTAIQDAIWAITDNGSGQSEGAPGNSAIFTATNPLYGDQYWIESALSALNSDPSYMSTLAAAFDVVSWQIDPVTGLPTATNLNDYSNGPAQTFLAFTGLLPGTKIETFTPEPGFYGILSFGMSGLFFSLSRRKKKA